jgi:hypothetical protein
MLLKPREASCREKKRPGDGLQRGRSRVLVGSSVSPNPDLISPGPRMLGLSALLLDMCVGTTRELGVSRIRPSPFFALLATQLCLGEVRKTYNNNIDRLLHEFTDDGPMSIPAEPHHVAATRLLRGRYVVPLIFATLQSDSGKPTTRTSVTSSLPSESPRSAPDDLGMLGARV